MHFSTEDMISICAYSITGFIGIMGNIALLVAIKLRSPACWKSYIILLTNGAIIDLLASISTTASIERFVPYKEVTATVYLGPCVLVSGFFCHSTVNTITLHAVTQSLILIVVCFCYRLYVLERSSPSSLTMIALCAFFYLPAFFILVASFFTNDPSNGVRDALIRFHPNHDQFEGYVMEGHIDIQPRPLPKLIQLFMIGPIIPMCITVFVVRWMVLRKINGQAGKMSENTKQMHTSLILSLHATLPIFYLITCAEYVIMKNNISHSAFLEYSLRWFCSCMHALSPLIMLYNVRPFRKFVLCRVGAESNKQSISTITRRLFPRFSFCDENPLKRSVVDSNPAFAEISAMLKQYEEVEQKIRTVDDYGIATSCMSMQRLTRAKTMLRLLMRKLSDADRILGGYSFTRQRVHLYREDVSDFTSFLHPDYGVCFTFTRVRNITRAGTEQALRMLMTVNQDSPSINVFDFLPTTESAAIRAVIHQPGEFPDFANTGFKLGAATQAAISISTIANARTALPYGNCTTEANDADNYYANYTYTFNSCQYSCLQRLAWNKCKCVDPIHPKAPEHSYCSTPADMLCLVDLVKQNVASPNGSVRYCDCFPPCSETRLARTITYGVYPSAKYKVALGTQSQRGILLEEQGGGREGVPDDDSDDYDNSATTPTPTTQPVCEPEMLSKADVRKALGDAAANCRVWHPQFYENPKYTIIQGWPCLSNKTCQTCIFYSDPSIAKWEWRCSYWTYEQCTQYKNNATTGLNCADSGLGPSSSVCRNVPANMGRANCWLTDACVRIPSSPDLTKLVESPLLDPDFLNRANLDSSTTLCSLSQAAVWAARERLNPTPATYGRKKRSALVDPSGQANSTGNSIDNSTTVDRPGYGSCEYANKNFKGAADCFKWYQRNGLTFELYFGTLATNTYTQSPTYNLVTMLSDVGGHAGLWLGLSDVSLVQFVGLFVMIFTTLFCRKKKPASAEAIKEEVKQRQGRKLTTKGLK